MSTFTAEKDALLRDMAVTFVGGAPRNVREDRLKLFDAAFPPCAASPKVSGGVSRDAVDQALLAYSEATNGETCFRVVMASALEAAAPHIVAERDAEAERLKRKIQGLEGLVDKLSLKNQAHIRLNSQLSERCGQLENTGGVTEADIEAAAKRGRQAYELGLPSRENRTIADVWIAVARAILANDSEAG